MAEKSLEDAYNELPLPDKPPYSPELDEHIPRLMHATSFTEYMEHQERMGVAVNTLMDPATPVDEFTALFPDWNFTAAATNWDKHSNSRIMLKVFEVFCRLVPALGLAPTTVDEKHEDFAWARTVCVLAAAGHTLWPRLCEVLKQNYAMFPYGDENFAEWEDLVTEASRQAAWPCTLPLLEWKHMKSEPSDMLVEHYTPSRIVGVFHVLKHCFLTPHGDCVNVQLLGVSQALPCRQGMTLATGVERGSLVKALLAYSDRRGKSNKEKPELSGVRWALEHLTPRNLLRQQRTSDMPPTVLHGGWSTSIPDPSHMHGFTQHGTKLTGVWTAKQGNITEDPGSPSDTLLWGWESVDPFSAEKLRAKHNFEAALPSTYRKIEPSEVFREAFPNMEVNDEADKILFDLPIYADLLRPYVPALRLEFPMVIFMPSVPSFDESTNQGKSLAAHTFARTMVPSIELVRIRDTNSGAPQARADVAKIEENGGTLALDEWRPPKSDSHILSHDNLQSLIVGGVVTSGKVGENSGDIRLSHSITASAKCLHFPPDMINRTFFWFLDKLTEAQMNNTDMLSDLRSGVVPLVMRLGAWADIEDNQILQRLRDAPKSSGAVRFEACNALIHILCSLRDVPYSDVERAVTRMKARYVEHEQVADDSGLLRHMAQPDAVRIGLADVLDLELHQMSELKECADCFSASVRSQPWVNATQFWKSLLQVHGESTNTPISVLLPQMVGETAKLSDRSLSIRLTQEVKRRLDEGEFIMHPNQILAIHGWALCRGVDRGRSIQMCVMNTDTDEFKGLNLERRTL